MATTQRTRPRRVVTPSKPAQTVDAAEPALLHNTPLRLFLTNLRLLDLDLAPDWPGVSADTFGPGTGIQAQKRRIQCVEWVLFHLFSIWDPEETAAVRFVPVLFSVRI